MQCERCHSRSASVHIRDQTRGEGTVLNLCVSCATRILGERLAGAEAAGLIGELMARLTRGNPGWAEPAGASSPGARRQCPECGLTAREFAHLGRVGCAACYAAFAPEIEARIRARHRGIRHVAAGPGQELAPGESSAAVQRQAQRELLTLQLRHAVAEEAFERAAQIRDALRRLG